MTFFAGCSDEPTTIATVEVKSVPGPTDKITTYAVGKSATLGQETVTIYSVTYKDSVQGKTPESLFDKFPNYQWAIVDVEIKNNDPQKTLPDPHFKLTDENGYEYGAIYYSGFDKVYDGSSLTPNEKIRGFQYIPVPKDVKGLKLKVWNYILGNDIAIFQGF